MKKLIFFVVFFMLFSIKSQTTRYIYETTVNPDTINLVTPKMERTFLDINGGKSLFISENKMLKDSISEVFRKENPMDNKKSSKKDKKDFPTLPKGKRLDATFFEYVILKETPKKTIYLENVGKEQLFYAEERSINWKISQEFDKINGFEVQKAVAAFGGRQWTAWFAKDIPISDGPYKFNGLPGLILKLEDENGDYRFVFEKKVALKNSYLFEIHSDAKETTRRNFIGDKAGLELAQNQGKKARFQTLENMQMQAGRGKGGKGGGGRGMGNEGGGMGNGGMGGRGMNGEEPPEMQGGGMPPETSGMNSDFGHSAAIKTTNPIELK